MNNKQKTLWRPTEQFVKNSNLKGYENWLAENMDKRFLNYEELWEWSVDDLEGFWESIWRFFNIEYDGSFIRVLSTEKMPGAKWFAGTRLNYAEHIFRNYEGEKAALVFYNENGAKTVKWDELAQKVVALQVYLKEIGIRKGDCVAAFLPNIPEAIISFLAVNSIGAVWSSCSPDFGVETVIERLSQIEPKLLIAADGYQYNGKPYDKSKEISAIRSRIKSINYTVLIPYLNGQMVLEGAKPWNEIVDRSVGANELEFTRVDFSHPIWVLYSSGTTGRPKAITHSHGGVLLEHLKYLTFHNDVKKGENFFWFTTTGWMMWNFLQASMLVGATPVLYDGSPGYPDMERLWEIANDLPIHHFGTSAPFITACMKNHLELKQRFEFTNLRSIGSTGAPLPPEAFDYVYEDISNSVWLCSMSGGTDVCTAFVGGNPYAPVYQGSIQARALGCALYAYSEKGERIRSSLGEMVIEKPMPCMPVYFWNDPDNERYIESYFKEYPGKWRHGDWINIFENGSLIIQGRSDATLNRKGIRIGTAEIYRVLNGIEDIDDSLILNIELLNGDDVMPLFVVLKEGEEVSHSLQKRIKTELRQQCSPRHIPDRIIAVPDIPYTLSGKKMEVPVKKIFMGMNASASMNRDAIRNPEAMDHFIVLARDLKF